MATPALYLVRMDVAHDHEATFNEVYDTEHIGHLRNVPGVQRASRYRQPSPTDPRYHATYELDSTAVIDSPAWKAAGEPRYLCAYEVERADLPMSKLWNDTSDVGRWKPEVRPYTFNKRFIVSERILSV